MPPTPRSESLDSLSAAVIQHPINRLIHLEGHSRPHLDSETDTPTEILLLDFEVPLDTDEVLDS